MAPNSADSVYYDLIRLLNVFIACYRFSEFLSLNTLMGMESREAEKILKYKDLVIEIHRMLSVKEKVISVIIGTTGTISESLRHYLSNIPGTYEIKELQQKNSHIGHCAYSRECANVKVHNIFNGRKNIHVAYIVNTEQLQYSVPQKHGLFQYINVNTLHEGYNEEDNNNNYYY
jgi:hypothetical protein